MSSVAVTATPEPAAGDVPPRIRLDIVDTGTPAITEVTVVRLNADGRTVPVRTADGNPLLLTSSGSTYVGLLYDYEMPFGVTVTYSTVETPTVTSSPVEVDDPSVWLIHPGVPSLSMPVELRVGSLEEEAWDVDQGVHWPMGRSTPVVQTSGTRRAPTSSVTVAVDTLPQLAALRALLADAGTLLLNVPTSLAFGVDSNYIAVGGVRNRRLSSIGSDSLRSVELPFQVVDRPAGGSQATRTWADVLSTHGTWVDIRAAYATWADLLAGP